MSHYCAAFYFALNRVVDALDGACSRLEAGLPGTPRAAAMWSPVHGGDRTLIAAAFRAPRPTFDTDSDFPGRGGEFGAEAAAAFCAFVKSLRVVAREARDRGACLVWFSLYFRMK